MHHTPKSMTEDALFICIQDLFHIIKTARVEARREGEVSRRVAAAHVDKMRRVFELQEEAKAYGTTGPIVQPLSAVPFRTQLVGITAAERAAIEWKEY